MCPLRFILVFFSAALAAYFAWRTVNASSPAVAGADADHLVSDDSTPDNIDIKKQEPNMMIKMIQNGFWVFVDMASGRYLWRNFKEIKTQRES